MNGREQVCRFVRHLYLSFLVLRGRKRLIPADTVELNYVPTRTLRDREETFIDARPHWEPGEPSQCQMDWGEHGNTWAGYQLRTEELAEGSGICSGGGHHAGVGNWCVHGHLQRDRQHPHGTISVPGRPAIHVLANP